MSYVTWASDFGGGRNRVGSQVQCSLRQAQRPDLTPGQPCRGGLVVVGRMAVFLTVFCMLPFVGIVALGLPQVDPALWCAPTPLRRFAVAIPSRAIAERMQSL